ncbi:MAG: ethanolamine ammonia-lyase light chain EutC, partial [Clostridia bacterium]
MNGLNDQELERLVRRVMEELNAQPAPSLANGTAAATMIPAGELLPDIGAIDLRREYLVEHPHDGEAFLAMKLRTPARVGVGHAGARHRTETMLRFQADHAAAQDAVFSDVPEELLRALSLPAYQTTCQSRDEFLTRPDKGRVFSQETLQTIRQAVPEHTTVLLYMAD